MEACEKKLDSTIAEGDGLFHQHYFFSAIQQFTRASTHASSIACKISTSYYQLGDFNNAKLYALKALDADSSNEIAQQCLKQSMGNSTNEELIAPILQALLTELEFQKSIFNDTIVRSICSYILSRYLPNNIREFILNIVILRSTT